MIFLIYLNKIQQARFMARGQHFVKILENSEKRFHNYINLKNFEILAM